jgi:methyl-accepting chemotaxis protein
MPRHRTFEQHLLLAFVAIVAVTLAIAALSVAALRNVTSAKDAVIDVDTAALVGAEQLRTAREARGSAARGYLLTGDETYLDELAEARDRFIEVIGELERNGATEDSRDLLEEVRSTGVAYQASVDAAVERRQSGTPADQVVSPPGSASSQTRVDLDNAIAAFVDRQEQLTEDARQRADDTAATVTLLVVVMSVVALGAAVLVGSLLVRSLRRTVGASIGDVQSASAELQASANQQAAGARQQATAMTEITTTISELLATARQISESAQRVAVIADQTAGAGREGEAVIARAEGAVAGMRDQMDVIVDHMLALGGKSQQIGGVLDIVSELAEQTNILAINATIEAAGAGESGQRFAVVADEIRKLSDRVAGSTKEIRSLIEDVRGAVNTTVMATEIGSKAVDSGAVLFGAVSTSFQDIAGLAVTTTDAAREIELSTKHQTTAVEQVNVAAVDVAQATRENEATSGQTLQTASQLTAMSLELGRLVKPDRK